MFNFNIVSGTEIKTLTSENPADCIATVERAYLTHHAKKTVNPDSYFLRFPKNDLNRIIALPASIDGDVNVSGIKWIASFPENVKNGIPRASAVLILNDQETGYPFACMEGALISAIRTAASAVLGAYWLNNKNRQVDSIAFIGGGVIARNIFDMFVADDWQFNKILIHDKDATSMQAFVDHALTHATCDTEIAEGLTCALQAEIVIFATNASKPYVKPPFCFRAGQIVLNISLRDIAPELILNAENIFDDVDHCMKASTSPHLAEQLIGDRRFVTGTLAQLMCSEIELDRSRPLIFSPFGMGILDLALGKNLFDQAQARGKAIPIPGFFGETSRW